MDFGADFGDRTEIGFAAGHVEGEVVGGVVERDGLGGLRGFDEVHGWGEGYVLGVDVGDGLRLGVVVVGFVMG